jgi:hypothetical protein
MSAKTTTTHSVETSGSGTATLAELREFLAATEYWPGDAEVEMEYHAPRDIRDAPAGAGDRAGAVGVGV